MMVDQSNLKQAQAAYAMVSAKCDGLRKRVSELEGWVEDAYLEGYSRGMTAGSLVCREEDWAASKARATLSRGEERWKVNARRG
jgi:hypothetical protein